MTPHLHRLQNRIAAAAAAVAVTIMMTPAAHAAGSSMPWEAPLQKILQRLVRHPYGRQYSTVSTILEG